jgi:hypothetical protein
VDINDTDSTAFRFLRALYVLSQDQKGWYAVNSIGWDLGLSDNETREIIQYLGPLGMLEWRCGARRRHRKTDLLSLSAVISEQGRQHVRAALRPADPGEPA